MSVRGVLLGAFSAAALWSPTLLVFRALGLSWTAAGLAAAATGLWSAIVGAGAGAALRRMPARATLAFLEQECRLCHGTGGVVVKCSTCDHAGRGVGPECWARGQGA